LGPDLTEMFRTAAIYTDRGRRGRGSEGGTAAADPPPADDVRRAALMFTTLDFASLSRVAADMAPCP
jgi:hypothetical protein